MVFSINKLPFSDTEVSKYFRFEFDEYEMILTPYPDWRAFISTDERIFWVEINPEIDVSGERIYFPKDVFSFGKDVVNGRTKKDEKSKYIELDEENNNKQKAFFTLIPEEIKRVCAAFGANQWEAAKAVKLLGKEFIGLMDTNPSLAFLIINIHSLNSTYSLYNEEFLLNEFIRKKQREVLRIAGFPATESMRKIFAKINSKNLTLKKAKAFRAIINGSGQKERILKLLTHSKEVSDSLFNFIFSSNYYYLSLISNKMLFELSVSNGNHDALKKLKMIYSKSVKWNIRIPVIDSVSRLSPIEEKLNAKIEELRIKKQILFGEPPFPDNDYIYAIRTPEAQIAWSKRQRNCIHSMVGKVKRKESYFYKIIYNGEEATLEVKRKKGSLTKGDLLGFNNKAVSAGLSRMVSKWFNEQKQLKFVLDKPDSPK